MYRLDDDARIEIYNPCHIPSIWGDPNNNTREGGH